MGNTSEILYYGVLYYYLTVAVTGYFMDSDLTEKTEVFKTQIN